jgi:hypothetical protein
MIQILPLAKVLHSDVVLEDDFTSRFEGWELVNNEDEQSFIQDSYYWMENKSKSRWMFYHKSMPVSTKDSFIIHAEIELVQTQTGYGQFGLVWGFTKPHTVLNKFVVSTQEDAFNVAFFQKDHYVVLHKHRGTYEKHQSNKRKQFFSIVKLEDYYYFYLNEYARPVYIVHASKLPMTGNRFGFYVEPGIMIRCDKIVVKRLITDKNYDGQMWMPLDENEMPLGAQILRGS